MDRILVTPTETFGLGQSFLQRIHDSRDRLMPLLLPGLDGYFASLLPGELIAVIAATHNGKSLFMRRWAQRMALHLKAAGREDEIIIWVDTEMPADYLAAGQVAEQIGVGYTDVLYNPKGLDMQALMRASLAISSMPIYLVATRLGSKEGGAEVHLTNIQNGIRMLQTGQIEPGKHPKIAAIFVDYLQSLPIDPTVKKSPAELQRRLQVSRDVDRLRVMGSQFDCPVIVGVQAKQRGDWVQAEAAKELALPGMADGMETYNIAQRPDRVISLSVAARNFAKGAVLQYHNARFQVRPNLLFVGVWKQRAFFGYLPAGDVFAYEMVDTLDPTAALVNVWSEWTP